MHGETHQLSPTLFHTCALSVARKKSDAKKKRTSQRRGADAGIPEVKNVKENAEGSKVKLREAGTRFAANIACVMAPRQRHVSKEDISTRTNE